MWVGLIVLFIPLKLAFVSIYVLIAYLLFCGCVVIVDAIGMVVAV